MTLKTDENRVMALAALFQACNVVREVAAKGKESNPSVDICIKSLFKIDSNSVADIYSGVNGLMQGLTSLKQQLIQTGKQSREIEVIRYVFAIIYLERKIIKQDELMQILTKGITSAKQQANYFSETHSNVIASLADLYQTTVSTLNPKIMVHGEPEILSNPNNANLIRALLLAAMRAAILWRQCGGNRWQLLFSRKKITSTCEKLIQQAILESNIELEQK